MEREILSRKDIKVIFSKELVNPGNLLFLFQKGWIRRAGVIPYTIKNGKYFLLLGEGAWDGQITDFGGGCKQVEEPLKCAIREFREETRESVPFDPKNITHVIVTGKKTPYQMILLVHFPDFGNEIRQFRESLKIKMKKSMSEIRMIRWVLKDNVFKNYRGNMVSDSLKNLWSYLMF